MKFLFDFFPILLFFLAYKTLGIYAATSTVIIASALQLLWVRLKQGRFEKIPLITFLMAFLFGGATLFLRNELFIKWKPTAFYWFVALAFFLTQYIGQKPLIQRIMEQSIKLENKIWGKLNYAWGVFAASMGFVNLYVIYHFSTDVWVNFKLFGTVVMTLIFIVLQTFYIAHHRLPEPPEEGS
jgi:intracellular septation protein